jgi:hypothetical protein
VSKDKDERPNSVESSVVESEASSRQTENQLMLQKEILKGIVQLMSLDPSSAAISRERNAELSTLLKSRLTAEIEDHPSKLLENLWELVYSADANDQMQLINEALNDLVQRLENIQPEDIVGGNADEHNAFANELFANFLDPTPCGTVGDDNDTSSELAKTACAALISTLERGDGKRTAFLKHLAEHLRRIGKTQVASMRELLGTLIDFLGDCRNSEALVKAFGGTIFTATVPVRYEPAAIVDHGKRKAYLQINPCGECGEQSGHPKGCPFAAEGRYHGQIRVTQDGDVL